MNKCFLQCKVVTKPELRYTQNDQTAIATFAIGFPDQQPNKPYHRLKAVAWGKLSEEAMGLSEGDELIVEGSLNINLVSFDGYKDKVGELSLSRIHRQSSAPKAASPARPVAVSPHDDYDSADLDEIDPPTKSSGKGVGDLDEIPF